MHIRWHVWCRKELRAPAETLPRNRWVAQENDQGALSIIAEGVQSGEFVVHSLAGASTTLAIISLRIDVSRWFSSNTGSDPQNSQVSTSTSA